MKLSDVEKRLHAPFAAHLIDWKPGTLTKDRRRALMMAYIDARAVMDRLDAICPDAWSFDVEAIAGAPVPTMRGTLTVLGVSRSDVGEGDPSSEAGRSYKAATSDALKRCAVHFGIGRYLYDLPKQWVDWDDAKRKPVHTPELPDWAKPDHERSPGGAQLVQALEQLRHELPEDLDAQRAVYHALKRALAACHETGPGPTPPNQPLHPEPPAAPAPDEDLAPLDDTPQPDNATLNREGAANLHRCLGPLLPGLKDAEVKAWVGRHLGREIASFEAIRLTEIAGLKAAARDYAAQQEVA